MEKKLYTELLIIFSKSLEIKKNRINKKFNKNDCSDWDSMAHMSLISNLEHKYNFKFKKSEYLKIDSIVAAYSIVKNKITS